MAVGRFKDGGSSTIRHFATKVHQLDEHVANAVNETMDIESIAIGDHIRAHAPWHDNTGNARAGLYCRPHGHAHAGEGAQDVGLELGYSVPYGKWLEIRDRPQGDRARPIIIPTLNGPMPRRIYRTLRRLMAT